MMSSAADSSSPKKVLITGITGQDGSYLAEQLVEQGDEVWGLVRKMPGPDSWIAPLLQPQPGGQPRVQLRVDDLRDTQSLRGIMDQICPDEVYHLAAQSHIHLSYQTAEQTTDVIALGTLRLLEAMKEFCPQSRFLLASSSEIFGEPREFPQTEETPMAPRNPYGIAKSFATSLVRCYRSQYGMFAVNAICFNHESPRRGRSFVTRKITRGACRIRWGLEESLSLGNLDARRDWGFAGEYVEGMRMCLRADQPDDYIFATGKTLTIREFCSEVFSYLGMSLTWHGQGVDETGVDQDGIVRVKVDPQFYRPHDTNVLVGNPAKAERVLGWRAKVGAPELVRIMCDADLDLERPRSPVSVPQNG